MKVYIGPYEHWFAPYRWVKRLLRWWYGLEKKCSLDEYDRVDLHARRRFNWLRYVEDWVNARYERRIEVRIDYYDTWNLETTLSHIVLPALKQLRAAKKGSPLVHDEDVPDELKSTSAAPLTPEQLSFGTPDENWHKRWEFVMGEMIWAFEQLNNPDAESQFHSDIDPSKPRDEPGISFDEAMRRGHFDKEGYMAWQDRKTRGLTLFGKYYEGLWD